MIADGTCRVVDRASDGLATTDYLQREIAAAVHTVEAAVALWNHASRGKSVRRALELVVAEREADSGNAR